MGGTYAAIAAERLEVPLQIIQLSGQRVNSFFIGQMSLACQLKYGMQWLE